jgi:hypothetical protein
VVKKKKPLLRHRLPRLLRLLLLLLLRPLLLLKPLRLLRPLAKPLRLLVVLLRLLVVPLLRLPRLPASPRRSNSLLADHRADLRVGFFASFVRRNRRCSRGFDIRVPDSLTVLRAKTPPDWALHQLTIPNGVSQIVH